MHFIYILFMTYWVLISAQPLPEITPSTSNTTSISYGIILDNKDNPDNSTIIQPKSVMMDPATGDDSSTTASTNTTVVDEPNIIVRAWNSVKKVWYKVKTKASALKAGIFGGSATVYDGSGSATAESSNAAGRETTPIFCALFIVAVMSAIT